MAETANTSRRVLPRGRNALDPELVEADQRERILAAMTELVAEHGFNGVRVADVIARAGVAKPRFYELYDSKAGCFVAVIDQIFNQLTLAILEALDPEGSVEERIRQGLTAVVEFVHANPDRARVVFVEGTSAGRAAIERISAARETLADFYKAMREESRRGDPSLPSLSSARASAIVGAINEPIGAELRGGVRSDPAQLRDELVDVVTLLATGHPGPGIT